MPSPNNLRVIYQNLVDLSSTLITASSTAGGTYTSNLKQDTKSLVWRSNTGNQAALILDLGSQKTLGGIVLAFSNLQSSNSTIRLIGYNSQPSFTGSALTVGIPAAFNTGLITCCPWNNLNLPVWGTDPAGSSNYSYGGGTYARVWLSETQATTPVRYLGIEISDPGNTAGYIEISRLIAGNYWSPTYNTGYGIQAGIKDLSEHIRTESGDLITKRGPRFKTLSFDLQWMRASDRKEITKIFLGNGMPKPLFVSLFPDSSGTDEDFHREGIHQIYGKMVQVPGVSYTSYEIYSTNMELEEV